MDIINILEGDRVNRMEDEIAKVHRFMAKYCPRKVVMTLETYEHIDFLLSDVIGPEMKNRIEATSDNIQYEFGELFFRLTPFIDATAIKRSFIVLRHEPNVVISRLSNYVLTHSGDIGYLIMSEQTKNLIFDYLDEIIEDGGKRVYFSYKGNPIAISEMIAVGEIHITSK